LVKARGAILFLLVTKRCESDKAGTATSSSQAPRQHNGDQEAIEPIVGVASAAYHGYMNPYIQLEERAWTNTCRKPRAGPSTLVGSTRLYFVNRISVYIKGSILDVRLDEGKHFSCCIRRLRFSPQVCTNIEQQASFFTNPTAALRNLCAGSFGKQESNQAALCFV
jgi:hypothetical protein